MRQTLAACVVLLLPTLPLAVVAFAQPTILVTEPGTTAVTVVEATLARETADAKLRQYLRDTGWQFGYDNPGNMSLWGKSFNGREYRSEFEVAVQIQMSVDGQPPVKQ